MAAMAGFNPGQYAANWELQLGSLGSGNHFIEVCADEADNVWLFLHSGSRGVGNKLAQLKAAMRGIEFRPSEAFIDEIPAAYKAR